MKFFTKFKANELKTLLMNASIYVFMTVLPVAHFEHFVHYVLFMRLLTQTSVSQDDINFASILINKFVHLYQELYGSLNMTYNLHCHLHLPAQVLLYGPLQMVSCFPFEGFFKICHGLFYGTRALAEQILKNVNIKQYLSTFEELCQFKICNLRLRDFRHKLKLNTHNNLAHIPNGLVDSSTATLNHMSFSERSLIASLNLEIHALTLIEKSLTFVHDAISMIINFF